MELDKEKIHYFQKNRDQFLMVDHVTDLKTGSYAKGYKKLNKSMVATSLALECQQD